MVINGDLRTSYALVPAVGAGFDKFQPLQQPLSWAHVGS